MTVRRLGIDYGAKRIGLAMCDPSERIVSPAGRVHRRTDAQAAEEIAALVAEEEVAEVVVGLPVNMDSTEGPQAKAARDFGAELAKRVAVPIHFQNEQLSSFTADERLEVFDLTSGRHKARRDAMAAVVILEDFLREKNSG